MEKFDLYNLIDVDFFYQLDTQQIQALKSITLKIAEGEFICLCGPSGSGKSTLLNLLGFIDSHATGTILFQNSDLKALSERQKNIIRRNHLGFIFQSFHLMPMLTVWENVEFFLARQKLSAKEINSRIANILSKVGLSEHSDHRPLELSGGQRQRVAIARALAKNPKVIIADEPTASLDQKTAHEIMELLLELNRSEKVSIIIAGHDPMIIGMAPKVIRLVDGAIVEEICR